MPTDRVDTSPKVPNPEWQSKQGGFYAFRNRLMAKDSFRRLMARLWPMGMIVRREARALFDLCAGFTYTQVMLALVEGGVIEALASERKSLSALQDRLQMTDDNARRLLAAGRSIGLIRIYKDQTYGLTLRGAALAGDPGIVAMVYHHKLLYRDLADPLSLFRSEQPNTELNRFFGYAANRQADQLSDQAVTDYSILMAESQRMISAEILSAHGFAGSKNLLDIGGGYGVFARSLLAHNKDITITVLDLPGVTKSASIAPENVALSGRLTFLGGDFLKTAVPTHTDTVTLVRVLFDHDDDIVTRLLTHLASSMKKGTRLFVAEPMAETPGADPIGDAYYGLYLKAMGHGRIRTADRHQNLLSAAGFNQIREIRTPQPIITRLIEARV